MPVQVFDRDRLPPHGTGQPARAPEASDLLPPAATGVFPNDDLRRAAAEPIGANMGSAAKERERSGLAPAVPNDPSVNRSEPASTASRSSNGPRPTPEPGMAQTPAGDRSASHARDVTELPFVPQAERPGDSVEAEPRVPRELTRSEKSALQARRNAVLWVLCSLALLAALWIMLALGPL